MQLAAALGQIVAAGPQQPGKAKPDGQGKPAASTEGQAVEGTGQTPSSGQAAGSDVPGKGKVTFADRLRSKLKAKGQEPGEAGDESPDGTAETTVSAVSSFFPEGLVRGVSGQVLKADQASKATQTQKTGQAKEAGQEKPAANVVKAEAGTTAVKAAAGTPVKSEAEATGTAAGKAEQKSAGGKAESFAVAEGKAAEKAAAETPVQAADGTQKAVKQAAPASEVVGPKADADGAAKAALVVKPEGVAVKQTDQGHGVVREAAGKSDEGERADAENAGGGERKFQVLPTRTAGNAETPAGGKAEVGDVHVSADRLHQDAQSAGEIQGRDGLKAAAEALNVKEAKAAATDSVFKPLTPSQQILKHLPDAEVLNARQIRITLNPAELGTVRISFQRDGGEVAGLIEAQRPEVRREIEQAMPQIVSALQQQGLQVRRVEVSMMNDSPANKDQAGQMNDPSMQKEFAHSGGYASGHAGSSSRGRSYAETGEGAETHRAEPGKSPGGYTGTGLNLYI